MPLLNQQEKQSPNLIKDSSNLGSSAEAKISEILVKADKILLFLVEAALVGLVLYNVKLSNELKNVEQTIRSKSTELKEAESVEKDARALSAGINAFKSVKVSNPKIEGDIELVYQRTPQEVIVKGLTYFPGKIKLTLSTPKSEYFAKLVIAFLESKKVSQISLESATLLSQSGEYLFRVEIDTKGAQ